MAASSLVIADFEGRVEDLLVDTGNVVWEVTTLDNALRQALADLGIARESKLTIEDLDSAEATTVEDVHEDLIVRGAAGYAAMARAIDRGDMASLDPAASSKMLAWATAMLDLFHKQIIWTSTKEVSEHDNVVGKLGAETSKINAEAARINMLDEAELAKLASKSAKIDAETSKIAEEEIRVIRERDDLLPEQVLKAEAETTKLTAEAGKVTSETTRIDVLRPGEVTKLDSETDVLNAQSAKIGAETTRINLLDDSEKAKLDAEAAKLLAEAAKIAAEAALLGAIDEAEATRLEGLQTSEDSPSGTYDWDEESEKKW